MASHVPDLALGVGARSEKGLREENQDKMTAFPTSLGTVYIVADGMGGHRGGAEASQLVIDGYRRHLNSFEESAGLPGILQAATALTNAELVAAGQSGDPLVAGMGSTVVMAILRPSAGGVEMMTAHIGDSRAYLFRDGVLRQLTHDHSAVQRMVDAQMLTREQARSHADANVLTRALGQQLDVTLEVGSLQPLKAGDTVLLCSDGLWGYLSDEELEQELTIDRSASETADALVQHALEAGSDDNITVQVLRLDDREPGWVSSSGARETKPGALVNPLAPDKPAAGLGSRAVAHRANKLFPAFVYPLLLLCAVAVAAAVFYFAHRHKPSHTKSAGSAPYAQPCAHASVGGVCVDRPAPPPKPPASPAVPRGNRPANHPGTAAPPAQTPASRVRQLAKKAQEAINKKIPVSPSGSVSN